MKTVAMVFCCLVFFLVTGALHAGTGNVQLVCQAGCMVFLDGDFKGSTVEELGGLVLQNLPEGAHLLKVVRVGYEPFQVPVKVQAGALCKVDIPLWVEKGAPSSAAAVVPPPPPPPSPAQPKAAAVGTAKAGSATAGRLDELRQKARSLFSKGLPEAKGKRGAIRVTSRPTSCFVKVKGLFWGEIQKTEAEWWARGVPAGSYEVICRDGKKILRKLIDLREGETYELAFDLVGGTVEDRTADRRGELAPYLAQEERFARERTRRIRTRAVSYGPLGRGRYRWVYGWAMVDPAGKSHEIRLRADWWARARGSQGSFSVTVDGEERGRELTFGEPCVLEFPVLVKKDDGSVAEGRTRYLVQCFKRLKDHHRGFDIRQDVLALRCGGYWEDAADWVDEDLAPGRGFKQVGADYVPFDFK